MPYLRHPSRFVVFSRSSRWKKGTGDVGFAGIGNGSLETSIFLSALDYSHISPSRSRAWGRKKYSPAFTDHGSLFAASVVDEEGDEVDLSPCDVDDPNPSHASGLMSDIGLLL